VRAAQRHSERKPRAQRQKSNLPDNDYRSAIRRLGASLMF